MPKKQQKIQQARPTPRRLELSEKDLAKIAARKKRDQAVKVDENWIFLAEFGEAFGWNGIMAILNNEIEYDQAVLLMQGYRKVNSRKMYELAKVSFIGAISARAKKNAQVFNKLAKDFITQGKADL